MRDLGKKKSNLRCLIHEACETVNRDCYRLICSTQFSMLENAKTGSRNILKIRKKIDLAIGIKLKYFGLIGLC